MSFWSFVIIFYIILVILIQTPFYYNELKSKNENKYNLYETNLRQVFESFGIAIFAFNCLTNFFSVAEQISNPNPRRLRKVFKRSFFTLFILLIVIGIAGYLSIGRTILDNDP